MTYREFNNHYQKVEIGEEICAFLVNNPEADAYLFIPYEGWQKDVVNHLNLSSEKWISIADDEVEEDADKRCLLICCQSDFTLCIRVEAVRKRLLSSLAWVESI